MRRISTAALLLGIGLFAGCEALPQIEEGKCGNQVKEPGEECDSANLVPDPSGNGQYRCITPDKDNACHYECVAADPDPGCPPGMACGDDNVCRTAGGLFAEAETLVTSGATRLQTAYFDGDGWLDLVAVGQAGISVHYLDENARWDTSFQIPSAPTVPAVIHRSADPATPSDDDTRLPALAVNVGNGVAVLTGRPERTLLPKLYDAFDVTGFEWFIAADALSGQVGDELVVIGGGQGEDKDIFGTSFKAAGKPTNLDSVSSYGGIEGVAAVAKLYTQPECESIALMFKEGKAIHIFSPCADDAWNQTVDPIPIPLPDADGRKAWGGVFAVHLNNDTLLDLVAGSQDLAGGNRKLEFYVADPETGDPAEFIPMPNPPQIAVGDRAGACGASAPMVTSFPLALGDVNDDRVADIIDSSGMLLSRNDGWLPRSCTVDSEWVKARIGRFNGDAFPDVAVVSRLIEDPMAPAATGPMSVEFRIGAGGGLFNPFIYPAMGEVADIFAGDFDGDVIDDLVVRETGGALSGGAALEDRLNMFYGSFAGGPEEPAPLGTLSAVKQIAVGKTVESDGLDDIMIVSEAGAGGLSGVKIMPGNTSRRILSPLFLLTDKNGAKEVNRPQRLCAVRSVTDKGEVTNSLVAFTKESEAANAAEASSRLWLAKLDGKADLSLLANLEVSSDILNPDRGHLLAALDVVEDGSGARKDEVVAFVQLDSGNAGLVVASADGALMPPSVAEPTALKIRFEADGMDAPMLVNDFDGNGWADIALLLEEEPGVVVFWNHLAGCTTGICADSYSVLRLADVGLVAEVGAPAVRTVDMAFLNADSDDDKELALLLDRGVFLFELMTTEGRPSFAPHGVVGAGGAAAPPEPIQGTQQLRGRSLAAFDADHDGLDDLIIGTDNEIALLRARWVNQ